MKADKNFAGIETGQLMLIPTPEIVDDYIRQIPKGRQANPFWRVISEKSSTARKLSFGTQSLKELRKKEEIIERDWCWHVMDEL